MTFGKYKGMLVKEIPPSYCKWLLKNNIVNKSNIKLKAAIQEQAQNSIFIGAERMKRKDRFKGFFKPDGNGKKFIDQYDLKRQKQNEEKNWINEKLIITFGKFKGYTVSNLPIDYCKSVVNRKFLKAHKYIKIRAAIQNRIEKNKIERPSIKRKFKNSNFKKSLSVK